MLHLCISVHMSIESQLAGCNRSITIQLGARALPRAWCRFVPIHAYVLKNTSTKTAAELQRMHASTTHIHTHARPSPRLPTSHILFRGEDIHTAEGNNSNTHVRRRHIRIYGSSATDERTKPANNRSSLAKCLENTNPARGCSG